MKALRINKKNIAKAAMALFFATSMLSLSGCPGDSKSGNRGVPGPGIGGTAGCPSCPAESPFIGYALGNSVEIPGAQLAMEFFTDNMAYAGGGFSGVGGGHSVFATGSLFVSAGLPCNIEAGRYNITGVLQPGVLNNIDMMSGLVFEAQNANGPSRIVVSISNATILSATPKLLACDGRDVGFDELLAGAVIEEVRVDNRYAQYCGLPITFLAQGNASQPACF